MVDSVQTLAAIVVGGGRVVARDRFSVIF